MKPGRASHNNHSGWPVNPRWIVAYVLGAGLTLLLVAMAAVTRGSSNAVATTLALAALLLAAAVCLTSWRASTGRLFDPYSILMTAVWLFNGGGIALSQILDPNLDRLFIGFKLARDYPHQDETAVSALCLIAASIVVAHSLALAFYHKQRAHNRRHDDQRREARASSVLTWVGVVLVIVSVVPATMTVYVGFQKVTAGGYMALFQEAYSAEGAQWYARLSSGLVPGLLYVAAGLARNPKRRTACYLGILAFSCATLALGTRAQFYSNAVGLTFFHHAAVRPIRRRTVLLGLAVAALLSTGVAVARTSAGRGAMTFQDVRSAVWESLTSAPGGARTALSGFFEELGGSLITVVYAMEIVPTTKPYALGSTYWEAGLSVLPTEVLSGREPGAEQGRWLIDEVSPETAAVGGGIGFSLIAEAYENFGAVGPALVLAVLGLALVRLSAWVGGPPAPWRIALAAAVVSIMVFSARGSSFTFARRTAWLVGAPYAVAIASRRRLPRQHQRYRPSLSSIRRSDRALGSAPGAHAHSSAEGGYTDQLQHSKC